MTANGAQGPVKSDAASLPLLARLVNHLLTPGSSLTTGTWTAFNVIMGMLFGVWLTFVISMPDNVHVWVFGGLFTGLAITTNWFMKEVFAAKQDFVSVLQKGESSSDETSLVAGGDRRPSAADDNATSPGGAPSSHGKSSSPPPQRGGLPSGVKNVTSSSKQTTASRKSAGKTTG